jgi:hypothetical protein
MLSRENRMQYQPTIFKEWKDGKINDILTATISENEATIDWVYQGIPGVSKATSSDGVSYTGTYTQKGDRGTLQFTRYTLTTRQLLLLGSWRSSMYAGYPHGEREFLVLLEPDAAS